MARQGQASMQLRLKHSLKAKVVASASLNSRSINAEIAHQLSKAYAGMVEFETSDALRQAASEFDMDRMAGGA